MNGGNLMNTDPFKEYIKQTEPGKRDRDMPGIQLLVFKQWTD